MNLREEILKEHSKVQCTKIVKWVGNNQQRFDELFSHFLSDEYRVVQRAAWPISYCVDAHPELINRHWKKLIDNLKKPNLHDAVKRNSIRLMQEIDLPKKYHGEIMNRCFKYLESPTEALAVKIFSLSVLGNLATYYPEIKSELILIIEDQLPHQSAGFKSRAKRVLKSL
ncbi:MAG: hypothetical protein IPL84_13220 [Chitinophagaceae bacterium]|nr:hypothetical protein [Chitinophagaceae bacterium]